MRGIWAGSLGVGLLIGAWAARGEEGSWRNGSVAPAAKLGRPVAAATVDHQVKPASYSAVLSAPQPVVRAQSPDMVSPTLVPPPGTTASAPTPNDERYNCGMVTEPPGASSGGFWGGCRDWFGGVCGACGNACSTCAFQSDHCFDQFISPVTNPFLFEDPRSLTEVRPIFMYQRIPGSNQFGSGNIEFFGLQGRLAFTNWLSLTINKAGYLWFDPNGAASTNGFTELWLGPKVTFLRLEPTGTVAAAGLIFQLPVGPEKIFQNTGDLSLTPYFSLAQSFLRNAPFGGFNFMNTTGYNFRTDGVRTDYFYTSFHLDWDVAGLRKFYPLIEANWFHYTNNGTARPFTFEGRDLFNFGSTNVSGNDTITLAGGARFKLNENIQTGVAAEFPVGGHRDVLDWRLTADLIFRY